MINDEIREFFKENAPDSIIFDNPAFDNSIVGISSEGNIVYDLNKMVEELAADDNISTDEAFDFVSYDTMRLLQYISDGKKPVIVDFDFDELYNEIEEESENESEKN